MSRTLTRAALLAATVALAAPAVAGAANVTYRDGPDVWVASPDGAVKRQLTTDGTTDAPYGAPSGSDAGDVAAVHAAPGAPTIAWLPLHGQRTSSPIAWDAGDGANEPPTHARLRADGSRYAYGYAWGDPDGPHTYARVAAVDPRDPDASVTDLRDYRRPSWWGSQLVVSDGVRIIGEAEPGHFDTIWSPTGDAPIVAAEISRNARRAVVQLGSGELVLMVTDGGPVPQLRHVGGCTIVPQGADRYGGPPQFSLSADGRDVVLSDQRGVVTMRVATVPAAGACPVTDVRVVSASGGQASFLQGPVRPGDPIAPYEPPADSGGTVPQPRPPSGGDPAPVRVPASAVPAVAPLLPRPGVHPAPTGAREGAVRLLAPRTPLRTALRRGLRITVAGAPGGRVAVRALRGRRVVATGTARLDAGGRARATLRFTRAARRTLTRARRVTLRVEGGGTTTTVTLTR